MLQSMELISAGQALALVQVVFVDLVLAGDNAVVVGMAVAGLPREQRARATLLGIGAATLMRILFASVTVRLLEVIGLTLAGGLLLLWVSWKLWREIEETRAARRRAGRRPVSAAELAVERAAESAGGTGAGGETDRGPTEGEGPPAEHGPAAASGFQQSKSLRRAAVQIVVADLSMSLDNVLAVAGIAREHTWVLVVGLGLSVLFMGVAAVLIARLITRFHWIAYVGLVLIFYVAVRMILEGGIEVVRAVTAAALGGA